MSDSLWLHAVLHCLQSLLKFMSIESAVLSNHLILCCPLFLLPSIFPSIRVFSNESALCISWPKYWSFSLSPSNDYSGLISFRIEWLVLLEVHSGSDLTCTLPKYHIAEAKTISKGSAPLLGVDCVPRQCSGHLPGGCTPACPQPCAAVELGRVLQDCWISPKMSTSSSILAWKIPWTEEPGRLQSIGCKEWDPTEHRHKAAFVFLSSVS